MVLQTALSIKKGEEGEWNAYIATYVAKDGQKKGAGGNDTARNDTYLGVVSCGSIR
jgi:hypothetical protein